MSIKAGFVPFVATQIQDALGNLLASGTVCVTPTDGNDVPLNTPAGGAGGAITQASTATLAVTAGALPANSQIADTAQTGVKNICYRITIADGAGNQILVYRRVQTNGAALNLDTYVSPQVAPQALQVEGPTGATGAAGIASLPALANLFNKQPASASLTNLFNVETVTIGSRVIPGGTLQVNTDNIDASDYIPVVPGGQFVCSLATGNFTGACNAYYDQNFAWVADDVTSYPAGVAITAPAGVAYVRLSISHFDIVANQQIRLNLGAVLLPWQAYGTYSKDVVDMLAASIPKGSLITSIGTLNVAAPSPANGGVGTGVGLIYPVSVAATSFLASFKALIAAGAANETLNLLVLEGTGPSFTVVQRYSLNIPTVNPYLYEYTFTAGVDYPLFEVQAGQFIGIFTNSGVFGFSSGTSLSSYLINSDPGSPGGSAETWTLEAGFAPAVVFDLRTAPLNIFAIGASFVGSECAAGKMRMVTVPYACTILATTLKGNATGSCAVDIWKTSQGSYSPGVHPVAADSIVATNKPTISSGFFSQTAPLDWIGTINPGDTLMFHIDSVSTMTEIEVQIQVVRL